MYSQCILNTGSIFRCISVLLLPSSSVSLCQRAMRVRSHSMETMVTHKHKSPGAVAGVPSSVSGGGLPQNSMECTKSTFTVLIFSYFLLFRLNPLIIIIIIGVQQCMCLMLYLCVCQPPVLSAKSPLKSPVKRRSGLFPRLHSSTESPTEKHPTRSRYSKIHHFIYNIHTFMWKIRLYI